LGNSLDLQDHEFVGRKAKLEEYRSRQKDWYGTTSYYWNEEKYIYHVSTFCSLASLHTGGKIILVKKRRYFKRSVLLEHFCRFAHYDFRFDISFMLNSFLCRERCRKSRSPQNWMQGSLGYCPHGTAISVCILTTVHFLLESNKPSDNGYFVLRWRISVE
jgi:hypothetical protein